MIDHRRLARRCRLVRYDARGHGRSELTPGLEGYSWAELARDQLALATALGIDRYVAAGASMGCGTALHAALLAPHRVAALVLVVPPTAWETRLERVGIWHQMADFLEAEGIEAFLAARRAQPRPDPIADRPEWLLNSELTARSTDPTRLAAVLRGSAAADLPDRELLASIGVPTLILAWTGDPAHPVTTAQQLAALVPGARLSVASTGDAFHGWTDQVVDFLDTVGPA
jgi:pimeloyl-ACP methyl ester carboxylesterase